MCTEITMRWNPQSLYDSKTKIWSGLKEPMDINTDPSLGKLLLKKLLENPDKIGQVCCHDGKEYTNQEIASSAISIANHLKKLGLRQNEVVGFVAFNTEYVASMAIGALLNGLAIHALDPTFEKDTLKHFFSVTKPPIVFCDGSIYNRVKSALTEIGSKATIYTMTEHISGEPDITEFLNGPFQMDSFQCEPLEKGGNQTAFIIGSSGTTGQHKNICMSHSSLGNPKASKFFKYEDRLFCFSPLSRGTGLLCLTMGTLAGSTRFITKTVFSDEEFYKIIEKYKPNFVVSPPTHLSLCLSSSKIEKCDFSSIKNYILGGAAVLPSLLVKLKPFFSNTQFIGCYGMSEIAGCIVTLGPADETRSVGKLTKNMEMKVINDDNECLGPNEIGKILVRADVPFSGYWGDPKATAAAVDEDGWIHSGDMGFIKDNGNIFIVDREKDILKYNDFSFSPTEIETVIMQVPDVLEVCVCGIPDKISAYLPAAMIVRKAGSTITEDEIYKHVADKLENFKQLRGGIFFVKNIPKTPSGKNLRRTVLELCKTLIMNKKNGHFD